MNLSIVDTILQLEAMSTEAWRILVWEGIKTARIHKVGWVIIDTGRTATSGRWDNLMLGGAWDVRSRIRKIMLM